MATKTLTTLILLATLAVGHTASAVETKIIATDGDVIVIREGQTTPRPATVGQAVAAGDKIMTRGGARAAIAFMESADTPVGKADLVLLGADTAVQIVALRGDDVPPMQVRLLGGAYRAQIRNGSGVPHFSVKTGNRVVELERADVAGTYAPDTDNAQLMCRDGHSVIRAGERRVKVAKGMYRAIDMGRILGARKMTPEQWSEAVAASAVTGVDVTMPEPPERAALAKPDKDGKFELVLTPDGVLPKEAVLPTTQGRLETPPSEGTPERDLEYVRMKTTKGQIVLELDRTNAPISTDNFLQYVDDGFYDGTIFHRVMSNFMIQAGGFERGMTKKQTRPGIRNEWRNGLKNARGTIAMARLGGQADSGTSQFFINVVDNPGLDSPRDGSGYAVFGRVVAGMDVVDAIRNVSTTTIDAHANVPSEDVVILSATRSTREEALE